MRTPGSPPGPAWSNGRTPLGGSRQGPNAYGPATPSSAESDTNPFQSGGYAARPRASMLGQAFRSFGSLDPDSTPVPAPNGSWSPGTTPDWVSPLEAASNPVNAESLSRPWTVWLATGALVVAALLAVAQTVSGILGVFRLAKVVEGASGVEPTGTVEIYVGSKVDTVQSWVIVAVVVLGVLFAICYAMFAAAAWRALAWVRYAATVLAVASLFGLLGGPIVFVMVVCGVVATAAMWSAQTRTYSSLRRIRHA